MHFKSRVLEIYVSVGQSSRKFKIRLFNQWFIFMNVKKPDKATIGVANETEDSHYVPFVDYDNINYDKVLKEGRLLINNFKLAGLAVICTGETTNNGSIHGSYHLIGMDKLTFQEHIDMLNLTSCDRNFKGVPSYYRFKHWVLRVYPKHNLYDWQKVRNKPYLKEFLAGKAGERGLSTAFERLLRVYYGLKRIDFNSVGIHAFDGSYELMVVGYETGK